uniref:CPW-WPC domain-containing protein n=1 Tax=viral metagenome TaxID=1070528 RepID=A0A6C0BSL9_9ZZZZ
MGRTQMIILLIMGFFLSISMYVIYGETKRNAKDVEFPPVVGECPDYYKKSEDSLGCESGYKITSSKCDAAIKATDFSAPFWSGQMGMCRKHKMTKNCGVAWDGISNNPGLCN